MKRETIRQRKLADLIKKEVSTILEYKLKDPRKGFITITQVKVSGDLRIAFIYYTVLGEEDQRTRSAEALEHSKNFIRSELSNFLKMRFVPELRFFYDDSLDYSEHINDILRRIKSDNGKGEN
jgi:ribosome-binding factor A